MLAKFSVIGFKGFSKKVTLDLLDTNDYQYNTNLIQNKIVKNGLLFGENASGKSNLGFAIFDIVLTLTNKYRNVEKYYQNYLNLEFKRDYAEFEYTFQFDDMVIEYIYYKKDYNTVPIYEKLIVNHETVLEYHFQDLEHLFIKIEGTESLNWEYFDNMSMINYLASRIPKTENHPIHLLMDFVNSMLWFKSVEGRDFIGIKNQIDELNDIILKNNKLKDFEKFLKSNGITYHLEDMDLGNRHVIGVRFGEEVVPFFTLISTGTNDLWLFYSWKIQLEQANIKFLFIDEFDANYHFDLAESVVKELSAVKNLQTILSTHNTYLMSNRITRPDCTFIVSPKRIVSLSNATDKELREAHNIEKLYRGGHFIA